MYCHLTANFSSALFAFPVTFLPLTLSHSTTHPLLTYITRTALLLKGATMAPISSTKTTMADYIVLQVLHWHPSTTIPTHLCCPSWLLWTAIMFKKKGTYLIMFWFSLTPNFSHNNPTPSSWHKRFLVLDQLRAGATMQPVFLAESSFFCCQNAKNWFGIRIRHRLQTGLRPPMVEKGYGSPPPVLWSCWYWEIQVIVAPCDKAHYQSSVLCKTFGGGKNQCWTGSLKCQ